MGKVGRKIVAIERDRPLPNQAAADDIRSLGFAVGPLLGSGAMSAVYAIERLFLLKQRKGWPSSLLHPMHQNVELVLRFFNEQQVSESSIQR